MGHFCCLKGRLAKKNPLVFPYKHLSPWHPVHYYVLTLKQKGVSYLPPLIFANCLPAVCKLWAMEQQLPGAPGHLETATSLQPPPPQPATLSALPNSLPTDHPIQSCPPLLPAKLDNGPWPPSALTFILLQLEGKLPVEITQTSRSNQKICIPAPFPSPKPLA